MSVTNNPPKYNPELEDAVFSADLELVARIIEEYAPGHGRAITVRLCQEFAGTYVYFSNREKLFRKQRNRWIIEKFDQGCKVADIARAVGLSERHTWDILGQVPEEKDEEKGQPRLF